MGDVLTIVVCAAVLVGLGACAYRLGYLEARDDARRCPFACDCAARRRPTPPPTTPGAPDADDSDRSVRA